ncbi:hypothetical protein VTN02DRAFT_3895 [Thermoascus thermophilus]
MLSLGISFEAIKTLAITFAPLLIPRAINLYRDVRVKIASRPPARPLPAGAARALNLLFFAVVFLLLLSLPFNPRAPDPNIFTQTRSRINTPTDVIFTRLARHRSQNLLTEADTLLRSKLTSLAARKVYLRFGPDALVSCQFCSLENVDTYLLYYLPFHTLIPHLLHMLLVGVVTSAPFAGPEAARWRNTFTFAGLVLAALDVYIMASYDPLQSASAAVRAGQAPPPSLYHPITLLRPLAFAIFDVVCALLIYVTATNRFFFTPPSQAEQVDQLVTAATTALTGASSKLHALSVTRNAVVRNKALKDRDDQYWRAVVAMESTQEEGRSSSGSVWEEEEVVRAMSRAMNGQGRNGGVDLARLGASAGEYVDGITAGLEKTDDERTG